MTSKLPFFIPPDYFHSQMTINQLKNREVKQLTDQLQEIHCKRLLEGIRKSGYNLYDDSDNDLILKPFAAKGEVLLKRILQENPTITASEFIAKISNLKRKDLSLYLESFESKEVGQFNTDQRNKLNSLLGTESFGDANGPLEFCEVFGLSEDTIKTQFDLIQQKHPTERMLEYLQKQVPNLTLQEMFNLLLDLQESKLAAVAVARIVISRIEVDRK